MIQTQPFEVTDFSGGITDYFIDGRPDQSKTLDNIFITPNKKPRTRWGSTFNRRPSAYWSFLESTV